MMKRALTLMGLLMASYIGGMSTGQATEYPLPPPDSRLIGENTTYVVPHDGRSLEAIASDYKIGLLGMLEANPGTDPYLPKPETTLTIPTQILLPDTAREGIVINLAELRMFYYPEGQNTVIVYPIGIGQLGRNTPVMTTTIISKHPNPTWTPTPNIRKHYKQQGIDLPAVVPAGPDNPMGLFAMRMAKSGGVYLIHGTNANFGIGMRVSSGCIRLRADDIEALFNAVEPGTRVQVVNEPIKVAVEPDGKRFIEVHQPLSRTDKDDPQTQPIALSKKAKGFINHQATDRTMVDSALVRRSGMPVLVNKGQPIPAQQAVEDAAAPVTSINVSASHQP